MSNQLYLKVLDGNMQSCNNGKLQWKINKWYSIRGKIILCHNGLHLTLNPEAWKGSRVFIAETPKVFDRADSDKVVCQKVRLLKELSKNEVADYEAKRDTLDADYRAKRAPLYADYEAKRAPLYADYAAKRDTLDADYAAKRDTLDADYEAKRDTLDADYEAKVQAILRGML